MLILLSFIFMLQKVNYICIFQKHNMQPSHYRKSHVLLKNYFVSSAYFIKIVSLNILEDMWKICEPSEICAVTSTLYSRYDVKKVGWERNTMIVG